MAKASNQPVCVGALKGPHGLKGMVKARLDLDDPFLLDGLTISLGNGKSYVVEKLAAVGQGLMGLKLAGIDTVEAAETLPRGEIFSDRADWPVEEGDVFVADMVGWPVEGPDGSPMGHVTGSLDLPAGTALDVDGKLVPLLEEFLTIHDGKIVLTALGVDVLKV